MSNHDLHWIANFIWGIADDVLRDLYVRGKYRDVILPMTVLRRLDAVLEDSKQAVLDMKAVLDEHGKALLRVVTSVMKDDTQLFKQFMDNEGFKRWMTDAVFDLACERTDQRSRSLKNRLGCRDQEREAPRSALS